MTEEIRFKIRELEEEYKFLGYPVPSTMKELKQLINEYLKENGNK